MFLSVFCLLLYLYVCVCVCIYRICPDKCSFTWNKQLVIRTLFNVPFTTRGRAWPILQCPFTEQPSPFDQDISEMWFSFRFLSVSYHFIVVIGWTRCSINACKTLNTCNVTSYPSNAKPRSAEDKSNPHFIHRMFSHAAGILVSVLLLLLWSACNL